MLAGVYLPGSAPSGACEQSLPPCVLREERAAPSRLQGSGTARRGAQHPDSPGDGAEGAAGPARPALPSAVAARPAGGARSPAERGPARPAPARGCPQAPRRPLGKWRRRLLPSAPLSPQPCRGWGAWHGNGAAAGTQK